MSPDDLNDVLNVINKVTELHTYIYRALNDLRSHKALHPEVFGIDHPEGNFAIISLERANETCVELLTRSEVSRFRLEAVKPSASARSCN
ncbi:hypothetical protein [Sphingomonas melonis]|uniref:hypothetical protein n=1 Tax=Sphingomonas melonis TaxID=152682 RepID=UPI0035C7C1F2